MSGPILETRNVTKRFGGLVALDDVSIPIWPATITGLIGPNGAGKSTLFNCINGVARPTAGTVWFQGEDITRASAQRRARLGLARTFQNLETFPTMTVRENLLVAAQARDSALGIVGDMLRWRGSRAKERAAEQRVDAMLDRLGLTQLGVQPVGGLSIGAERVVELGRALCTDPSVLLLDEPSSGLDHSETAALGELLGELVGELGVTVVLVEHDMSLVMEVCSSIYVLDSGELISSGTPEEVQGDPRVIAAYLGSEDEDAAVESAVEA